MAHVIERHSATPKLEGRAACRVCSLDSVKLATGLRRLELRINSVIARRISESRQCLQVRAPTGCRTAPPSPQLAYRTSIKCTYEPPQVAMASSTLAPDNFRFCNNAAVVVYRPVMALKGKRGRPSAKNKAALSDDEASDYESAPPVKSSRNSASSSAEDASAKPRRNGRASKKEEKEVVGVDIEEDVNEDEDEDEDENNGLGEDVYVDQMLRGMAQDLTAACRFIVESIKKHMIDDDVRGNTLCLHRYSFVSFASLRPG